jgi:hypothetical protein
VDTASHKNRRQTITRSERNADFRLDPSHARLWPVSVGLLVWALFHLFVRTHHPLQLDKTRAIDYAQQTGSPESS